MRPSVLARGCPRETGDQRSGWQTAGCHQGLDSCGIHHPGQHKCKSRHFFNEDNAHNLKWGKQTEESYLFISLSGKQPEAGDLEESSLLILNDEESSGKLWAFLFFYICINYLHIGLCVWSPHHIDIILIAGDLLVVRWTRQCPPGCDAITRGLGCTVVPRLTSPHQQQSGKQAQTWFSPPLLLTDRSIDNT